MHCTVRADETDGDRVLGSCCLHEAPEGHAREKDLDWNSTIGPTERLRHRKVVNTGHHWVGGVSLEWKGGGGGNRMAIHRRRRGGRSRPK